MSKIEKKDNIRKDINKTKLLFECILLILMPILILIFDRDISTLSILYLLPISLVILSIEQIIIASKNKKLDNFRWILVLIEGLLFLLISFYIVVTINITSNIALILFSISLLIKNIFDFIAYKDKSIIEIIKYILIVIISILLIIFNDLVIKNLILVLLISLIILGIIKLIKLIIKK